MSKWISFPAYADAFPFDIRCAFGNEAPAGRHGFLTVKGDKFVFEDGTVAKFWGANFNSALCFPSHEYAEQVARRVASAGVNIVRLHQMDADWSTPNIFQYAKGPRLLRTSTADPESLDRMDYLIKCLKENGVYIYMDILTYRKFRTAETSVGAEKLVSGAKIYSYIDPEIIQLQKEFAEFLWTHVNPYTSLAYKDDPAVALTEITNEDDLFARSMSGDKIEPFYTEFCDMYRKWATEHGYEADAKDFDPDINTPSMIEFKSEVMENHYRMMSECWRKIGVKIPICGTNWTECAATVRAQRYTDFNDGHAYLYWIEHARMNDKVRNFSDDSLTAHTSVFAPQIYGRLADKPYFISEWDEPWPMTCRAESPILLAAVSCLQGWSGATIHTYAYGNRHNEFQPLGMEVSSRVMGMGYHRQGQFTTWNDPAKFGLFPHAALMVRRGDVRESENLLAIKLENMTAKMEDYNTKEYLEAMSNVAEYRKAGVEFDDVPSRNAKERASIKDKLVPGDGKVVVSDTGELYKNTEEQYGIINSPRTQVAYGYIGSNKTLKTEDITIKCKTDFAVIATSSLTDDPISKSDNILITAVGRASNTDEVRENGLLTEIGRTPILAEVIEAEIEIRNANAAMVVYGITAEGYYTGAIPTVYENGKMKFKIGDKFPSIYYQIVMM
ncbi:MAG: cellulase family glycosylhydrolase [Clostridia bacterium]|nr:cellulase family glycosylhydrolase [Clostridia bacterium]